MDTNMKIINSLRNLAIDMIYERKEGDASISLSVAPTIYTLFVNHLNFVPTDPTWINRDRLIVSNPNLGALLYSTLYYAGYNITLDSLKKYGTSSSLPLYPEYNPKIGIEITSGTPGLGLNLGVGISYGTQKLKSILGKELIDNYTYIMITDEDLMNSTTYEALSFALRNNLNKLIILYNSFETTRYYKKNNVLLENTLKSLNILGYNIETVSNGEDYISIDKAITKAKTIDKPTIIEIKTSIGIGTTLENSSSAYGKVLNDNDMDLVKDKMHITKVPFHISGNAYNEFKTKLDSRITPIYNEWVNRYNKIIELDSNKKDLITLLTDKNIKINLKNIKVTFDKDMTEDLRITNNKFINAITNVHPFILSSSLYNTNITKTKLDNIDKNIIFNNDSLSSSLIAVGISLTGFNVILSTTLNDSIHILEAIKLSTLMNTKLTFIFVNSSILESSHNKLTDPLIELSLLRSIPLLNIFKPSDLNELLGSWDYILNKSNTSCLILPSLSKGVIPSTSSTLTSKGAYIVKDTPSRLSGVLLSSGNELELTLKISEELTNKGIYTKVVSIPSVNILLKQDKEYIDTLFPVGSKVVVIELSNDSIWNKFVYNDKYLLTLNNYITSGTKLELIESTDYNFEKLLEKVEKLLK